MTSAPGEWRSGGLAREVGIFLLGEAVSLMRSSLAESIHPVGWPTLSETMKRTLELKVPISV